MLIHVSVSAFYEWEPASDKPSDADIAALLAKPAAGGGWLNRVEKVADTFTQVGIPEQQITELVARWAARGVARSRERVVAELLEEVVMPHHAPPDKWTKIEVHDEPGVEKYLTRYFNVGGAK